MPTGPITFLLTALLAASAVSPVSVSSTTSSGTGGRAPGEHQHSDGARLVLTGGSGLARIPIDLRGNHIYLRGRINDSDSLWMVLDSGASSNAIDAGLARALGLATTGSGRAQGAGGSVDVSSVTSATVRLPGATLEATSLGAMPLGAFRIQTGRSMDVILGHPLISRCVLRIDYVARTLDILPADSFRYQGSGTVLPLTFERSLPYIRARITLPGRAPVEGRFVIDLGSSQALILGPSFVRDERVVEALPRTVQARGRGVGGQIQSLAGRVSRVEFGGVRIDEPVSVLRVSDQGFISAPGTAGNIGGEILRRFLVILDYPRKRMILEPNAQFGEPFDADMSGLTPRLGPEGSGALQVDWIQPGSPAAEAGLLPEDLIEQVNGRPAEEIGIPGLREMFRRAGETHRMRVRRGDTRMEIVFTTRRLI